jgi:hypothetical protein
MIGLLERMERNNLKVDAMVLGTAYNNMRRDHKCGGGILFAS